MVSNPSGIIAPDPKPGLLALIGLGALWVLRRWVWVAVIIVALLLIAKYEGWWPFNPNTTEPPVSEGAGTPRPPTAAEVALQRMEFLQAAAQRSAQGAAASEATAKRAAEEAKASASAAAASGKNAKASPVKATQPAVAKDKPKGKSPAQASIKPSTTPTNSWPLPPPSEVKRVGPEPTPPTAQASVPDGPPYVLIRMPGTPAPWQVGSNPCRGRCPLKGFVQSLKWPDGAKSAMIDRLGESPDTNIQIHNGDYFEAMGYGPGLVEFNVVATWDSRHTEPASVWRVLYGTVMYEVGVVPKCTNPMANRYHVRYVPSAPPAKDYSYLGVIPRVLCP